MTPVAGNVYTVTSATIGKSANSGVPAIGESLSGVEDVQIDPYGNIIIADAGNNLVRAIYMGKGPFFGIPSPKFGYIYTVAGCSPLNCTALVYPKDGTTPTVPATSTPSRTAKSPSIFAAMSTSQTPAPTSSGSSMPSPVTCALLAGNYGGTAGADATGCAQKTNTRGDGCPGPQAAIYVSSASNSGFGTSRTIKATSTSRMWKAIPAPVCLVFASCSPASTFPRPQSAPPQSRKMSRFTSQ